MIFTYAVNVIVPQQGFYHYTKKRPCVSADVRGAHVASENDVHWDIMHKKITYPWAR